MDGVLAACCWKSGIHMKVLRSMGLGKQTKLLNTLMNEPTAFCWSFVL
ncbi:MAG: hypothetical protein ABIO41_05635 [Ignavibacteria bacterium]